MSRSKTKSEYENLKGIIRRLKSENRHLRKEIGRSNKKVSQVEGIMNDQEEEALEQLVEIDQEKKEELCPKCNKHKLDVIEIGTRLLLSCECGYRRSKKK